MRADACSVAQVEDGLEEVLRLHLSASGHSFSPQALRQDAAAVQPVGKAHGPMSPHTAFLTVSIQVEQHSLAGLGKAGPLETTTFAIRPSLLATNLTSKPVRLHLQHGLLSPASPTANSLVQPAKPLSTLGMSDATGPHDLHQMAGEGPVRSARVLNLGHKQPTPINALWSHPTGSAGNLRSSGGSGLRLGHDLPQQSRAPAAPFVSIQVNLNGTWHAAEAGPSTCLRQSPGLSNQHSNTLRTVPDGRPLDIPQPGNGTGQSQEVPGAVDQRPRQHLGQMLADEQQGSLGATARPMPQVGASKAEPAANAAITSGSRPQLLSLPLMQGGGRRCVWFNQHMQPQQPAFNTKAAKDQPALQRSAAASGTLMCAVLASSRGSHLVIYEDPQPPLVLANHADVPLNLLVASDVTQASAWLHRDAATSRGQLADAEGKSSSPMLSLQPGEAVSCTKQWGPHAISDSFSKASGDCLPCLAFEQAANGSFVAACTCWLWVLF